MNKSEPLLTAKDFLSYLEFIRTKRQEYFVCLSLDSGHRLLKRRTITIGLLDTTLVHPREVFADPLKDRTVSVLIAHNHPSGYAEPSNDDIKTTQQLIAAGQLLGINVVDHVIVTKLDHYSFEEAGFLT